MSKPAPMKNQRRPSKSGVSSTNHKKPKHRVQRDKYWNDET